MINHGLYTDTAWSVAVTFTDSAGDALELSGNWICELWSGSTLAFTFKSTGAGATDGTIITTAQASGILEFAATPAQHVNVTNGLYRVHLKKDASDDIWQATGKMLVGKPGAKETYLAFDDFTGVDATSTVTSGLIAQAAAAAASAAAALASENAAEAAQSAAETASSTATTQSGIATTQAGIAVAQAGIATTQAGIATTQADAAISSASAADASADAAALSALNASASAIAADGSADAAAASATAADASADAAAASQVAAAASETAAAAAVAGVLTVNSVGVALNNTEENIYLNSSAPEWASNLAATVSNGDGTFTVNTVYTETVYNATGRLAVGKRCALAVRIVSGSLTLSQCYIRFKNGASTISTSAVGATPDQDGYYSTENVLIPATTTTIEVRVDPNSSGDVMEIVFCPAAYTYAARNNGTSKPASLKRPLVTGAPVSFIGVGQAVQGLVRPNGTARLWEQLVLARGGTASSTALTALREAQEALTISGLIDKLFYVNFRVGDTLSAALTPFLDRFGFGYDQAPASFTTWTEANGLTGVTVQTGINPRYAGITRSAYSLGMYLLNDIAGTSNNYCVGGSSGTWGLQPHFADFLILDMNGATGRIQGSVAVTDGVPTTTYPTKGMLCGARDTSGTGFVYRNGMQLGARQGQSATVEITSGLMAIDTSPQTSGGEFAGWAMTADDIATITFIFHELNKAIGRGVTGVEGLN